MKPPIVLVVDDDLFYRETLTSAFERKGYQVFSASDGGEGFQLYKQISPDVIVLDRIMPKAGGTRFLLNVDDDSNDKDAVLIVYSSTIKDSDSSTGGKTGAKKGFSQVVEVSKNTPPGSLFEKVKDLLPVPPKFAGEP